MPIKINLIYFFIVSIYNFSIITNFLSIYMKSLFFSKTAQTYMNLFEQVGDFT